MSLHQLTTRAAPRLVLAARAAHPTVQPLVFRAVAPRMACRSFPLLSSFTIGPRLPVRHYAVKESAAPHAAPHSAPPTTPQNSPTPAPQSQPPEPSNAEPEVLPAKLSDRNAQNTKFGMGDIFRLFSLARREVKPMFAAFILLCTSSAVSMSLPMSIGKLLDAATVADEAQRQVFGIPVTHFFALLGGLFVVGSLANFGRVVLLKLIGERLVARLRSYMFRKTISQDAEFFDSNRVGDLISRLSTDANIVSRSVTQNVSDGLRSLVSGAVGLAMMSYVSPALTGVMLVLAPPVALGAFTYGRRIRHISRDLQESVGTLTKVAEEQLSAVKTVQSFTGEISEVHRYNKKIREVFQIGKREAFTSGVFFGATGFIGNVSLLSLLIIGTNMVTNGSITLGELTSFMMYAVYTGSSMFGLSSFYSELMKGAGAASRLFELVDRHPRIPLTVGRKMETARGAIEFRDVYFHYPTRPNVEIFQGLSFIIPAGSNVCVVGPSGGGKSTITQLLLRFYDPNRGQILINGVDIREYSVKSLRRHMGVVQQEPVLFSGTIAENIAYGVPDASREDIERAARRANCSFIYEFPDQFDTTVGPRGAQLSGGQKQRIAIARALIKNPDVLFLDEATSALDTESEAAVNEALVALMNDNCTTISIAHRLSTIKRADHILVLGTEGKVVEWGKFATLFHNKDSELRKLLKGATEGETPSDPVEVPATSTEVDVLWDEIQQELEMDAEEEELVKEDTDIRRV